MERVNTVPNILWITQGWPSDVAPSAGAFHCETVSILKQEFTSLTIANPIPWVPYPLEKFSTHWKNLSAIPKYQKDGNTEIYRPRYLTTPKENHLFLAHLFQHYSLSKIINKVSPSLIHAHFAYSSGATALWIKKKRGIPYVLTLHGDDVTVYPYRNKRAYKLFKKTVLGASKVLAVSHALAEEAKSLVSVDIDVLPNGIDTTKFFTKKTKEEARNSLGLSLDADITIYVGNLTEEKGILDLKQSLMSLKWDKRVSIFIGDGPELSNLQSDPRNVCLGAIPRLNIPVWLKAADYFLLPSYHEGLGQAAVEAGAVNLPVIGGNVGGLAGLLKDERGILVTPGNTVEITQALELLKGTPQYARKIANNLASYIIKNHDAHHCAKYLEKLYIHLTAKN
ncbi:glycosyltransferase [Kiloniella laminariae]|uniref:glycosyltransferase n=1 Tax=Kiloniella laminariae TaxID=454162 RepID=UPI0003647628|nr:glycosyltransferase [Kiloniella laminariae]